MYKYKCTKFNTDSFVGGVTQRKGRECRIKKMLALSAKILAHYPGHRCPVKFRRLQCSDWSYVRYRGGILAPTRVPPLFVVPSWNLEIRRDPVIYASSTVTFLAPRVCLFRSIHFSDLTSFYM